MAGGVGLDGVGLEKSVTDPLWADLDYPTAFRQSEASVWASIRAAILGPREDQDRAEAGLVRTIRRRAEKLKAESLKVVASAARSASKSLPFPWSPPWVATIDRTLRSAFKSESRAWFEDDLLPGLESSFDHGRRRVDAVIGAVVPGLRDSLADLNEVPGIRKSLAVVPPELVRGLGNKQAEAVMKEVRASFALGESPADLVARLEKSLDDPGPWKSVAIRAEVIARTEWQRVVEAAAAERTKQVAHEHPALGIMSIYAVVRIDPWPCARCEPWEGRIFRPDGSEWTGDGRGGDPRTPPGKDKAHRPILPIHTLCRCYYVPWIARMGRPTEKRRVDDLLFGRAGDPAGAGSRTEGASAMDIGGGEGGR